MMTPDRIAELRALAEAATPGPWMARSMMNVVTVDPVDGISHYDIAECEWGPNMQKQANAGYIAAARTALPEALDAIERVRDFCAAHGDGSDLPYPESEVWENAIAHVLAALDGTR